MENQVADGTLRARKTMRRGNPLRTYAGVPQEVFRLSLPIFGFQHKLAALVKRSKRKRSAGAQLEGPNELEAITNFQIPSLTTAACLPSKRNKRFPTILTSRARCVRRVRLIFVEMFVGLVDVVDSADFDYTVCF
jgi:hypothetical protein